MITLHLHFPKIKLEELILWATLSTVQKHCKLKIHTEVLKLGKKPGVNLISGIDFKTDEIN
jgi:hypothetical protein